MRAREGAAPASGSTAPGVLTALAKGRVSTVVDARPVSAVELLTGHQVRQGVHLISSSSYVGHVGCACITSGLSGVNLGDLLRGQ